MRKASSSGVVWQVIAPVIRWPLYSPARLALFVGSIVAVCVAVSLLR